MTWKEYQAWALTKREGPPECMALGLAGETGELVDTIKKVVYHKRGGLQDKLVEEAGDVLFYLSQVLWDYNITLEQVMETNVAKLNRRYPNGFVPGGGIR